ncbi:hypothetical protein Q31b_34830 [Novipirellula aureliae]|uniref:Uncharacterized protein n=1 Tax=Novipirellula aureliae TaxID=2527966 RepID=A0A5C6DTU4_9BACT|nr:hypothetical protein [Novipirellula aureliae]TWU40138.1 hypothetical protein Q31b_34830 [Novipirellula aureliae]
MIDPNGLAPLGERDLIHQRDKPIGVLLDNGAVFSCQSLAPMGQAHWGPLQQWWRLARSVNIPSHFSSFSFGLRWNRETPIHVDNSGQISSLVVVKQRIAGPCEGLHNWTRKAKCSGLPRR